MQAPSVLRTVRAMGASSGWNLVMRRPARLRATPTSAARTVVRLARVPSGTARQSAVEHPRARRPQVRAPNAG
jgi:hypothetical protein